MRCAAIFPILLSALVICAPARAGLYDDDAKNVTKGDLDDQDYWWTKYDMMMLDLAIKQHQPEGRIAVDLASTKNRLDDLIKKYPKHEQLKKWKDHVDEVMDKIDPNADRSAQFNPGCPWDESNFAQAWVNYHWGKMKIDAKEDEDAFGLFQNVKQNFDILLAPDRMKDYPEDLRKWVQDSKPEVDKIYDQLKEETHH